MAILNFACCGILVFFITTKNGMDIGSAFLLQAWFEVNGLVFVFQLEP